MFRFSATPVIHEQDHLGKSDRDLKDTERSEMPVSKYVNVGREGKRLSLKGMEPSLYTEAGQRHSQSTGEQALVC